MGCLVSVQSMLAGVKGMFEVLLSCVDRSCRRRGIEDPEHGQPESGGVKTSQFNIAAVTVGSVRRPSLQHVLGAIRLTDILPTVTEERAVRHEAYRCSRITACNWG